MYKFSYKTQTNAPNILICLLQVGAQKHKQEHHAHILVQNAPNTAYFGKKKGLKNTSQHHKIHKICTQNTDHLPACLRQLGARSTIFLWKVLGISLPFGCAHQHIFSEHCVLSYMPLASHEGVITCLPAFPASRIFSHLLNSFDEAKKDINIQFYCWTKLLSISKVCYLHETFFILSKILKLFVIMRIRIKPKYYSNISLIYY